MAQPKEIEKGKSREKRNTNLITKMFAQMSSTHTHTSIS